MSIVRDFNTFLSVIDRITRKIRKDIGDLNTTINKLQLTDT